MQRRANTVFAPIIAAAILTFVGANMAVSMAIVGDRFLPSLNNPKPVLAGVPPTLGQPQQRLARRVILIIIDGLRLSDAHRLTFLNGLRLGGIDAAARSTYPTFSRPNYVTILTGVPPQWSGVRTNAYDDTVAIDSLMDRVRDAGMKSGYATDYSPELPTMFASIGNGHVAAGQKTKPHEAEALESDFDDMYTLEWRSGLATAAQLLLQRDYQLVVLLPGAVDAAGHKFGAKSDEYRNAARLVDDEIEEAIRGIDLAQDAVVIVADHGHTNRGGHGGLEKEVLDVPLIMAGAGVRAGAALAEVDLTDIAPTVAALLGLPSPGHALGRTLIEALAIPPASKAKYRQLDQIRREANRSVLSRRESRGAEQGFQRRVFRLVLVFGFAVAAALALLVTRRFAALDIDVRVLAIGVPAFPVTYYALLGLFGQQFSPSAIPARGAIVGELFTFGLVSTIVHVLLSWVALRGRIVLRDRLAAANALTVCGLFGSSLPAGLAWALVAGPFVEVPSPSLVVLIPATYVAVSSFAVASAVTLALEIIIFFARAIDPRIRLQQLERAANKQRSRIRARSVRGVPGDPEGG